MGSNYTRMLAPPHYRVRVDVVAGAVEERRREGWRDDPFPDDRESIAQDILGKHKNRPALVCASGPSMAAYPREMLLEFVRKLGCVTWTTNCAWNVCDGSPMPSDYLVILDESLHDTQHRQLYNYLRANPDCLPCFAFTPQADTRYHFVGVEMGLTADQGPEYAPLRYFNGCSSGVAAVCMAFHCGCNPIYLLGHDCGAANGKTHGSGVRSDHELTNDYPQGLQMLNAYGVLAQHAKVLGVEVINLSPCSRVKCFPVRRLTEVMEHGCAEATG